MFYPPNLDSVQWLMRFLKRNSDAFKNINGAIVDVAGRAPVRLKKDASDISFAGFVDDSCDFIVRHKVFIAPLRFGAGVQTKVLEAMALGMPVITTPIGARGIGGAKSGENIFIVDIDDEAGWVRTITALWDDQALRARVGDAARKLVKERYTASRARAKFLALVDGIASRSGSR
jgi:glycosyltransferase involved in cell wall biosynthesis